VVEPKKIICDYETVAEGLIELYELDAEIVEVICDDLLDKTGRLLSDVIARYKKKCADA